MTATKYLAHYLIPLFHGSVCEFSVDWCHARMVPSDAIPLGFPDFSESRDDSEESGKGEEEGEEGEEEDDISTPSGYLQVSFLGSLPTEAHRSSDAGLLARPHLLRVLSLLTYFCGSVYTVGSPISASYHLRHSGTDPDFMFPPKIAAKLVVRGVDRSAELAELLNSLELRSAGGFTASLLDRWRKGLFLLQALEETAADEAALCFFHILEAVGNHYKEAAEADAKSLTRLHVEQLVDRVLLQQGAQREQMIAQISKGVVAIVTAVEILGVRALISFAFSRLGMFSEKTNALVGRLVKYRNGLAHARQGAEIRRSTWPAPAFFYQTDPRENDLVEILQILSARTIAAFAKIPTWTDEWADVEARLHPPDESIQRFVSEKRMLSPEAFERGDMLGVRPSSVTNYWLSKKSKLGLQWLENALGAYVSQISSQGADVEEFLMAAILLADSSNAALANVARERVREAFSNKELGLRHPSDLFKEFLTHDVEPVWFRSWARQGRPKEDGEG